MASRPTSMEMSRGRQSKKNGLFLPIGVIYYIYFCCFVFFVLNISVFLKWFTIDSDYTLDLFIGFASFVLPVTLGGVIAMIQSQDMP